MNSAGGIEPSGRAREGRRALGGGRLDGVRDFNTGGTRRLCLRLGLAFAPGGVISSGLIKLRSATMDDISVGAGVGAMIREWDGYSGVRDNIGPTRSLA